MIQPDEVQRYLAHPLEAAMMVYTEAVERRVRAENQDVFDRMDRIIEDLRKENERLRQDVWETTGRIAKVVYKDQVLRILHVWPTETGLVIVAD